MVTARAVTKVYAGTPVVDRVDVSIDRGECWGLLGPNGAGKTTFLRMLVGRTPPTSGDISVLGYDIPRQASSMRARIGVVPQLDNLDPDFTVNENLHTYAGYFGIDRQALTRRVAELLEFASLSQKADAYLSTLSGGMLRRLSLIRALVNEPELLVLDEPTTGLDPQARQLIWQRLRRLRSQGITLILTTHYMEEAERLCDRVGIIDEGVIKAEGSRRQLIELIGQKDRILIAASGGLESAATSLRGLAGVADASVADHAIQLIADEASRILPGVLAAAAAAGAVISSVEVTEPNLEAVFLHLTGKALRD